MVVTKTIVTQQVGSFIPLVFFYQYDCMFISHENKTLTFPFVPSPSNIALLILHPNIVRPLHLIKFFVAVRLVGGSDNATGRVEVYYNDTWGTVCDDYWSISDARVVCGQLGFRYALNAYRNASYGQGTGPIFLDNVNCLGSESSLFSCRHGGLGNHNCRHSQDASVRCGNTEGENKQRRISF